MRSLLLLTSSFSILMGAPALAQSSGLDEIIVTARKQAETLQDVPLAVTAVTKDYIESRGITSIESLSSLAPNLKVERTPGNTTGAQISIRGGVTINPALTWEPTVGIYLDGVYIGKTQGSIFDVADLERAEVLRGPQGTLYGRNTLAGAINLITAKPTGEYGGKVQVGYGNYNDFTARASVNFNQTGPFKVKLSGMLQNRDGFIDVVDNPFPGVLAAGPRSTDELESVDKKSFLVAVRMEPSNEVTLDYSFDFSFADQAPTFSQIVSVSPNNIFDPSFGGYVGFPGAPGQFFGFPLDLYVNADRQETATVDGDVFEKSKVQGHNLTATFDLGNGHAIKSISALRKLSWDDALDLDGSPLALAHTQRLSDYESLSQEFQLTGTFGDVDYVAGAYYFDDDGQTNNPQSFFGGANEFDSRYAFTTQAFAIYGQADFPVSERLALTGGLRWTQENKTIDRTNILLGPPPFALVPARTTAEKSFARVSPSVTANFDVNDDINLYAKYSSGFKSGGFNGEAGSVVETQRPYRSEIVDSFEIGSKARFFDNRMQLNAAAFFNKHRDMQLSVFLATGAAASDIRNAGRAEIKGFEIEGLFQIVDGFTARGSLGYLDPEYKEFIEFGIDVTNDRAFPHAPDLTASAGFDARIWQGDIGRLDLTADINHSAEYFTFPYSLASTTGQNANNTVAASRTLLDARLALSELDIAGANATLAIWGRNLTDKEYLANFIDFGPGFGGLTNGYFGPPRTYGVTLGIDW